MLSVLPWFQDKVRSQDSVFVVAGVTGSVSGRDMAWKYVQDNWKTFIDRYEGGFLLSRLVKVGNFERFVNMCKIHVILTVGLLKFYIQKKKSQGPDFVSHLTFFMFCFVLVFYLCLACFS